MEDKRHEGETMRNEQIYFCFLFLANILMILGYLLAKDNSSPHNLAAAALLSWISGICFGICVAYHLYRKEVLDDAG